MSEPPPRYTMPITVRFADCDPAGLVFYPRYYEMLNLAIERFFEEAVGHSFAKLHLDERLGVPTVRIETDFRAASRLEDRLAVDVWVERVGRSSVAFRLVVRGDNGATPADGGDVRLETRHVLVAVDLSSGRAVRWPEAIAMRLRTFVG